MLHVKHIHSDFNYLIKQHRLQQRIAEISVFVSNDCKWIVCWYSSDQSNQVIEHNCNTPIDANLNNSTRFDYALCILSLIWLVFSAKVKRSLLCNCLKTLIEVDTDFVQGPL